MDARLALPGWLVVTRSSCAICAVWRCGWWWSSRRGRLPADGEVDPPDCRPGQWLALVRRTYHLHAAGRAAVVDLIGPGTARAATVPDYSAFVRAGYPVIDGGFAVAAAPAAAAELGVELLQHPSRDTAHRLVTEDHNGCH